MEKKILLLDKNFLTALADYIFTKEVKDKTKVALVFDDTFDMLLVKHTFLEYKKVINCEVNCFFLSLQQDKLDNDSIVDFVNIVNLVSNGKEQKFCILLQNSILNKNIVKKIKPIETKLNSQIFLDEFLSNIIDFGYKRVNYVESIGEFAVRGNVVDIWYNGYIFDVDGIKKEGLPVRIVLEEDIVSKIKKLDISSQRSLSQEQLTNISIFPITLIDNGRNFKNFLLEKNFSFIKVTETADMTEMINLHEEYKLPNRYFGNLEIFNKDISKFISDNYNIILGYNYDYEVEKINSTINLSSDVNLVKTKLSKGFYSEKDKVFFITYPEIFSKFDYNIFSKQKIIQGLRLDNIWEIQPGDYVVHREYGIAKFLGISILSINGVKQEFITLLFKDNDKLYIPVTDIELIEKYISLTEKLPQLSSLDRESWQRVTKKIKESIREFIFQLYVLYTKRKSLKGIYFKPNKELEDIFAETFEYEETEDQKKAIEDVLSDMEKPYPMDRIIVGDVGFGKTEVALRAAFRAILNGKQVVLLCPTTVLAEQHFKTFTERLEPFGIKVGLLTRLQSKKEKNDVINKLKEEILDIVIGTHTLLNDRIKFHSLGLVIIDEEHRFGVRQKEKIKLKFKSDIFVNSDLNFQDELPDVLSLTATPIPRTLAFGLEGIKDISVIETPPEGRLPIETYVSKYDEQTIIDAISRELHRGGQIYYVFNDISLIEQKTNKLSSYFPNVNIKCIHSKLPAKKIEEIMIEFIKEQIQILVTTTIIEAGLDLPNVNTIIVEKAEKFGLAQLYQLRGRVGRRDKKAYCYLFYSETALTFNAKRRLAALLEFKNLGSGYRLALRDLEIRGAGEVLGTRQHGFVNEVGLSMYSKIVQQIVGEITGVETEEIYPKIELQIEAYIPEDYITDVETRILFYRKLLQSKNVKEVEDTIEEIYDRFGKPQHKFKNILENLFLISKLRVVLSKQKVLNINYDVSNFTIIMICQDSKYCTKLYEKLNASFKLAIEGEKLKIYCSKHELKSCIEKIVELLYY